MLLQTRKEDGKLEKKKKRLEEKAYNVSNYFNLLLVEESSSKIRFQQHDPATKIHEALHTYNLEAKILKIFGKHVERENKSKPSSWVCGSQEVCVLM